MMHLGIKFRIVPDSSKGFPQLSHKIGAKADRPMLVPLGGPFEVIFGFDG
jgi:hypothetical protein